MMFMLLFSFLIAELFSICVTWLFIGNPLFPLPKKW